jgi:hypothetical protein
MSYYVEYVNNDLRILQHLKGKISLAISHMARAVRGAENVARRKNGVSQ